MNFKSILFAISIIQFVLCHPISNGSSYCDYTIYRPRISIDCNGLAFYTGICDHFVGDLDDYELITFKNCEINELSDIFKAFPSPNTDTLVFLDNNTLASANFSQADHLSLFVMKNGQFKTTPTSFSMNAANLELFQFNGSHSNDIDSISLKNATKLEFFSLENTTLSHFPADLFKNSIKLKVVHAKFNKIESIDSIEWPDSVKWISFDSNKITKLAKHSFESLTNLEILDLSKNKIREIEKGTFSKLNNLIMFSVEKNCIEKITNQTFEGLDNLKAISLQNNQIETIQAGAFKAMPKLCALLLDRNKISSLNRSLFTGLNNLIGLNLGMNPIRKIASDTFADLTNLKKLNMSSGALETIDLNEFRNTLKLFKLDLSNNNISHLVKMNPITMKDETISITPESVLLNAYELINFEFDKWLEPIATKGKEFLAENTKQEFNQPLEWVAIKKLLRIYIDFEFYETIPFKNSNAGHQLNSLLLSRNQLNVIDKDIFSEFKLLEKLFLSNNPITTLYPESFVGLHELKELHMAHCALTSIDFSIFSHLTELQTLDLSYNKLITINNNQLTKWQIKTDVFPQLSELRINNNNNLNCSNFDTSANVKIYCGTHNETDTVKSNDISILLSFLSK